MVRICMIRLMVRRLAAHEKAIFKTRSKMRLFGISFVMVCAATYFISGCKTKVSDERPYVSNPSFLEVEVRSKKWDVDGTQISLVNWLNFRPKSRAALIVAEYGDAVRGIPMCLEFYRVIEDRYFHGPKRFILLEHDCSLSEIVSLELIEKGDSATFYVGRETMPEKSLHRQHVQYPYSYTSNNTIIPNISRLEWDLPDR